jgi:hypothetical protein
MRDYRAEANRLYSARVSLFESTALHRGFRLVVGRSHATVHAAANDGGPICGLHIKDLRRPTAEEPREFRRLPYAFGGFGRIYACTSCERRMDPRSRVDPSIWARKDWRTAQ